MSLSIGQLVGYVDLDTGPAEQATDKLGGVFQGASGKWAKVLGGGGVAAGAAFATSLTGAISAEPASDKLAAQLGDVDAEKWGDITGKVYSNGFGEGLEDVSAAIGAVVTSIKGMRNASDADVQQMTERAMTYADVMEVDVARAAQVAGGMIHAGLAKNGGEAFDLLMKASQKVPAALREDVLDATEEYGQFFSQIGMDGPQAMAAIVEGSKKGQFGIDKMGDAVKEFSILVSSDMARTKPVIKELGLNYGDTANAMLAGGDKAGKATQDIVAGLLKIKDPAKQARAAVELFGTPIEDLNAKDLPKFLKSLQTSGKGLGKWKGTVDDAGKTAYDNASTNLSMFGRGLKTYFVDMIGGKVLPKVTELTGEMATGLGPALDVVGKVLKKVGGFLGEHAGLVKALGVAVAAFLIPNLILMGIESTKAGAKAVAAWFAQQKASVKTVASFVIAKTTMVAGWVMMGAKAMASAVRMAAAWLVALGPVGIVIAIVAGLVGLVIKYWDQIKAATVKAWNAVVGVVVKVWLAIKSGVSKGIGAVIGFVKKRWPLILGIIAGPLGLAVGMVIKHWSTIKSKTAGAISNVVGLVKAIPGKFKSALSSLKSVVSGLFSGAMNAAKDKVVGIGSTVVGWIKEIPGKLAAVGGKFATAGRGLLQQFIDGMKNAAGIISGIAGNVWTAVRGLLNGAITKINRALEFTIDPPGPGKMHINPPDIPGLAGGGRVTGSTLAEIGEGREAETVLPDSLLRGLLERVHAAGRASAEGDGTRRGAPLIGTVTQQPGESAETLAERLWFMTRTRG